MIRLKGVSKVFSNGLKALDTIELTIQKNEFVYLVGPSGAGKSTLLNLIFRADIPSTGDIIIDQFSLIIFEKAKSPI